jgi:3-oxoacyl-[acyl-carrier protein] reductase
MKPNLARKIAIITGSGRGLGRASAIEMARAGASVVILSRTITELKDTENEIMALGAKVIVQQADVSKPADIKKVIDKAISHFGRIDILMNNAAIIGPIKPIHGVKKEEWEAAMNTNLHAVFLFSTGVVPYMTKQGGGKIINVTSGLGEMVKPLFGVYSVAKAGVIHLTRIMAEELRDCNIKVNGLDPGVIDTRMQDELRNLGSSVLGEEVYIEFKSLKDKGYLSPPEKIARLAVFLASNESDSIIGENGTEDYYKQFGYKG